MSSGFYTVKPDQLIDLPPEQTTLEAGAIALAGDPALPGSHEDLFAQIIRGELQLPLSKLAKRFGLPRAKQVVTQMMRHFNGLPPDEDSRRLFDMSYRNWQHWAHYHGLTWEKVRKQ